MSHVRLSIIDLTYSGHQPFVSADGNLIISYNGEIYNYVELRKQLEAKGYVFRLKTDTEVVLYAYKEWGSDCFCRFNGMWAVAIYNRQRDELLLCRDRFGVKPLFYHNDGADLIFASEMKVILGLLEGHTVNVGAVRDYLAHCWLFYEENTFFNEIKEVRPAHVLWFKGTELMKEECYWKYRPEYKSISHGEALEKFGELFRDAVRIRMRSDVPVGSLLSGGLDSNTIVGELGKNGMLSDKYETFSAVYEDERYSEKKYIDFTKEKWRIKCNLIYMEPMEMINSIEDAMWHSEVPIRSISFVLSNKIYDHIRKNSSIKVVLNGQGADELFGGYTFDYFVKFYELAQTFHWGEMFKEMSWFHKNRNISYYQILRTVAALIVRKGLKGKNAFNDFTFQQLLTTPFREYLMSDDRASMAYGIEARVPFIDYRLVEFAFSLPSAHKITDVNNKMLIREYASNIVDWRILERRDKMGYVSPQEMWQRKEWASIFDKEFDNIKKNGLIGIDDISKIDRIYADYKASKYNDGFYIFRVFCLSRWSRLFGKSMRKGG